MRAYQSPAIEARKGSRNRLNWKNGLLRLWVVVALCWCAGAAYTLYFDCGWFTSEVCFSDLIPLGVDYRLVWVLSPPAILLGAGTIVSWCIDGFRNSN